MQICRRQGLAQLAPRLRQLLDLVPHTSIIECCMHRGHSSLAFTYPPSCPPPPAQLPTRPPAHPPLPARPPMALPSESTAYAELIPSWRDLGVDVVQVFSEGEGGKYVQVSPPGGGGWGEEGGSTWRGVKGGER